LSDLSPLSSKLLRERISLTALIFYITGNKVVFTTASVVTKVNKIDKVLL